ncbi:MAG: 1-acyl-sn-glycerol-3-phosphate acyltransferase [Alphaproteobacteria bacterium]|nr:1-acyl-sn-glycerol-3-phosphate acyltransferase [Alphaproteobacteria bacterium]
MKKTILIIRSTIYFILFMITAIIFCVSAVFTSILPSAVTFTTARIWCKSVMFLLRVCCGIKYHVTGLENIPHGKTVIFASKHQSAWETFAYQIFLKPCVFMYKRELAFIPLFGIAMIKTKNIPVNRGHGNKEMIKTLRTSFANRLKKYSIIIFPEGTRTKPNAKPNYKSGLSIIIQALKGVEVVPIAMNSGVYWPKHGFIKYPGTIEVHILPPIKTSELSRDEFQSKLIDAIETEQKKLPSKP